MVSGRLRARPGVLVFDHDVLALIRETEPFEDVGLKAPSVHL
jgi:hypothetical protein